MDRVHAEALDHARHMAAMGGWVTATYFTSGGRLAARRWLEQSDLIRAGTRGHNGSIPTFELTASGERWIASQEV